MGSENLKLKKSVVVSILLWMSVWGRARVLSCEVHLACNLDHLEIIYFLCSDFVVTPIQACVH